MLENLENVVGYKTFVVRNVANARLRALRMSYGAKLMEKEQRSVIGLRTLRNL